jgi:serine/threonine-protein kinase RsbW
MEAVRELEPSRRRSFEIELALEEILTNVIQYAYPDREGDVEIDCRIDEDRVLRVSIRDWGAPFDPTECQAPMISQDACERPMGGLGIHLTRQMANDLIYERLPDGNRLSLIFEL